MRNSQEIESYVSEVEEYALGQLSLLERSCLLRAIEVGFSLLEIAEILNIDEKTVEITIYKACERFLEAYRIGYSQKIPGSMSNFHDQNTSDNDSSSRLLPKVMRFWKNYIQTNNSPVPIRKSEPPVPFSPASKQQIHEDECGQSNVEQQNKFENVIEQTETISEVLKRPNQWTFKGHSTNNKYQLGRYRLLRTLASKEHLDVYEGVHLDLGRRAAIKALYLYEMRDKRERQRDAERFRQESYWFERIRHPHIVELYDYGEEDGIAYMVMQFAPYGSLAHTHPLGELLSFNLICKYARQIGSALQALHDAGWIHRDVKPGNVFLGARKQALLGDFGLGIEDHSKELPRSFLEYGGTKVYMAPEQAKGEPCPASDQYAFATMLFEWLTGCRPFEGTANEILWQRQHYPIPSLRELAPDISTAVETVILKALQMEPLNRYESVRDFVKALEYAFDPPGRHATTVKLPYYAGTSRPSRLHVAHRYDSRSGQRIASLQRVAEREAIIFDDEHSLDVSRHVCREDVHEPQFDGFTVRPLPLSIHEDAFEVDECDLELGPADGEGLVRRVWNRLGNWGKS